MLKVNDLKVNYGGIEAVKGISFEVPDKSIVTLIGANGAGKSTTLKTISGLVRPKSGTVEFEGENITAKDPTYIMTKGITLVPEGRKIFPNLTVLENLKIGAYLRRTLTGYTICSPDLRKEAGSLAVLYPAASSRCWQ